METSNADHLDPILEGLTQAFWHASSQTERDSIANAKLEIKRLRKSQFSWIPVGERLPTREHASVIGEVFCVVRVENFLVAAIRKVPLLSDVTHWAPIPPLPEKSQESTNEELAAQFLKQGNYQDISMRDLVTQSFLAGLKAAREQKAP